MGARNPEVDAWFDRYDNPMKAVGRRMREVEEGAIVIEQRDVRDSPFGVSDGKIAAFRPARLNDAGTDTDGDFGIRMPAARLCYHGGRQQRRYKYEREHKTAHRYVVSGFSRTLSRGESSHVQRCQ